MGVLWEIICMRGLKYPPILRQVGAIAERAQPGGPAHGIASKYPSIYVSYVFPLPYPVRHDRHDSFPSFVDHAVWVEEPPGGKIALNAEAGHSATRYL